MDLRSPKFVPLSPVAPTVYLSCTVWKQKHVAEYLWADGQINFHVEYDIYKG